MVRPIDPLTIGIGPRRFERADKSFVMRPIHICIVLGRHNQNLPLNFRCTRVWRIHTIHGQANPVYRGSGLHYLGKFCGNPQGKRSAHTITSNTDSI